MFVRRNPSTSTTRIRIEASAIPVIAATVFFCLILGALYYSVKFNTGNDETVRQVPRNATDKTAGQPDAVGEESVSTIRRLEQTKAHLEFGEFGPALEVARSATDPKERTQLLHEVAAAQMRSGEFGAALSAIRQMPIAENRVRARGERATQLAVFGGAQADPQPLIDLIFNETTGPWEALIGSSGNLMSVVVFSQGIGVENVGFLESQHGCLEFTLSAIAILG